MGLLNRRKSLSLSEIVDGLLAALNDVCEMQQLRHIQFAEKLMNTENGEPVRRLRAGGQETEIPLSVLSSCNSMELKEVHVSFPLKISDAATRAVAEHSMAGKPLTYDDLEFVLEKAEGGLLMKVNCIFSSETIEKKTTKCDVR